MKILYLVSSDGIYTNMKGGAGTHIRGTIKGFRENGIEVITFIQGDYSLQQNNRDNKNYNKDKKKTVTVKRSFFRVLGREIKTIIRFKKFKKELEKIINKEKPNLIYERSCLYACYGGKLSRKYSIPHFIETSGCLVELTNDAYGVSFIKLANFIEKKKLAKASCVITEADSAIDYVRNKFILKNKNIISKPLGINFDRQLPSPIEVDKLKKKYQISNDFKVVGYVGTFASYHKIESLLPVFEQTKNLNIKYILVGSGGNYEHIKKEVERKGLENVVLTGYISFGIENYFSLMNIGLIPDCEHHMAPIKYYEYGLYKLCPLVPNYRAFDKLLVNGINGYTFSNTESLIKVIENIDNVEVSEIKNMGQIWHDYVISNYSWNQVVKGVINEFNK